MVYSTYQFILVFLPIVLLIYFGLGKITNRKFQKIFLVLASLFFYGYYNYNYLLIIVASIIVNYFLSKIIQDKQNKLYFIIGIFFNIGLLGYFKYFDFFVSSINTVFKTSFILRNIVLPLGISFFTFQQLLFLVSIYKKEEVVENFLDYCIFVTFFPQLVAGPIVLYGEMLPQFRDGNRRHFNLDNFCQGLYIFCIGAFKKAVIADTVALFADKGFSMSGLGLAAGWVTSLSYTLQIYFDFSGYSDMAIGLGKMFNIDIPENFNSPYKSQSITEFWRRWHITLGRALSTYIYKPLGGNRKGIKRTCINLLITFLISGLWHGAAWTFVVWGGIHGALVAIERIFRDAIIRLPKIIRIAITFLITNVLWVLFRAESFNAAITVYKGMININNIGISQLYDFGMDSLVIAPGVVDMVCILAIMVVLLFVIFRRRNSTELRQSFEMCRKTSITVAFCFLLVLVFISRGSVFIYFNF